jgi:WASH complex subunit FAM21
MQILDELEDKARRCCGDVSEKWTVADDARLATFVQEFTAHIQRRAESIADSVVALENKKDKAATKVELAKSAFLRLSDQRYVEQVVVDGTGDGVSSGAAEPSRQDDGDKDEHDTADISGQDAINQQQTVENQAIRDGMKALELFYDPAHATGSEDHYFGLDQGDDSAWYYESAPADTFNQRPLPYVVGSREFMESTDAGLGEECGAEEDEDGGVDGATDGSQVGTGDVE